MDDRNIMENLLLTTKGVCDLYMHGAIEAGTKNVHSTFVSALSDSISMQEQVYQKMSEKGWYASKQAPVADINQVRQKFNQQQ